MKRHLFAAPVALLVLGGTAACGSSSEALDTSRCIDIPDSAALADFEVGIDGNTDSNPTGSGKELTLGKAVESTESPGAWFVASQLRDTSTGEVLGYPVFLTMTDPTTSTTRMSVGANETAEQYFSFPYGPDTNVDVVSWDDPANATAEQCATTAGGQS